MQYAVGDWYALVSGRAALVVAPDYPADRVRHLWEGLGTGSFGDHLQQLLADAGHWAALPSFALVALEAAGAHVAVRGTPAVVCRTAHGTVTVDGQGIATWREEWVDTPLALAIECGAPAAAGLWPLAQGVVRVSRLQLVGEDDGPAVTPTPGPPAGSVPRVIEVPAPGLIQIPVRDVPAEPATTPPPSWAPEPAPASADPAEVAPDPPPDPLAEASGGTTLLPDADEGEAEDELHSTTHYRAYFGDDPVVGRATGGPGTGGLNPVPAAGPTPEAPPLATPVDDLDGLTTLAVPADPDHDGLTVLALPDADHDGLTVMGCPPAPAPGAEPPAPPAGPSVLARLCPACRTPNPTRRTNCRACGVGLTGDAVQIPRPALGHIQLPDGEVLPIDHPVVLGRKPEALRFTNADIPVLKRVDDPHVSSVHLRLDLEDWSVLVTSLGRNGTILRRAGQPDRRFADGEQALAQAGDVYCLTADLSVTILDLA